ncbi:uncharacterized protein isoform X2 [Leptinotarsa decemlineata]|uniref:uncharacterized protein isoform X2 n=1 Tax=Leptinotarsa decemlineata TaxID=7539 RepID=UPI003D304E0B
MEVVAATPNSGGVPPFRDHDVREWSRIDSITGALERARIETDHWSANTINSSHKYGKVVDSRARTDAEGGLHQSARRQLEVFHSQIPGGRLHVVKTHTVATSKWTNKDGGLLGGNRDFENLQLPLNPLDLTPQKSKATVGRSVTRRPPTRHHLKDPISPPVDYSNPLRQAHITAATNLHRVSRLCHQIHESAVKQAFGRRSPRPAIKDRKNGDGSVEIYEIESVSSENTNTNGHTNLVRTKSSSSDDINLIPEKDIGSNKSAEDLEDLEELQSWRRTSKIRRSLQFPKQNKTVVSTKPPDLPENIGSVRKIREDLEKGRRLNTALRNNSVDLEALDQILQSISSSSTSSDKTPDDDNDTPRKQKRNSFVTVESLQEVKGRLRRTSSPTSDIYKGDDKDEEPDDGIVTEETHPGQDKEMPLLEQSRVRSYVYGMESLLNKKPGIGTGSLESRVKLINGNTTNRNEDWYNRRKSYGFEQVHNHNNSSNSILHKNKNLVESSTDSGICRSTEIVSSSTKKNGLMVNERYTSDEHSDIDQKYNDYETNKHSGTHFGQVKKLTNTFIEEDRAPLYSKTSTPNGSWAKYPSEWSNSKSEIKSTTITIPIAKNKNIVDLSWNDSDREIKRHSIAVDESKYVTNNTDSNKYRRTSLALNDQFSRQEDDDSNTRRTKKVEFCKTEVHFAAESGKVNIVATDEKPPPTQNFRRRRRNSGPTLDDFNKNGLPVLHFGDTSYEKTMFSISDEPDPITNEENSQPVAPLTFGLVTVNTTNTVNSEITEDDKKELTENEIKGILKNKPIKPRPYHLGETVPFNDSNSDEDNKWGVRLRHVDKPETPIWKSTVTVHNYNYFDRPPQETGSNGSEPEFQKLLKSLRPIRKSDYASDNDNRYDDLNTDNRKSSWSMVADANKPVEDGQTVETKGYSTKINFEEGEARVVESDSYDLDRHTTWPRTDSLGTDSKQLLNKGLVVRIGREDSALNHTVCSKMTTTQDINNTTTTTKITIDLSPSPPIKNDSCFTYAKYQGSHSHSFKSTSLILNTIKDKSEKTAEKKKNEIPHQLEALKKLYEDIQSDSDADKEVQQLMSKVSQNEGNRIETDTSSEVSGSWSKMRAYKNMSDHFGRSSVKEATARYDLKSGAKAGKVHAVQRNSLKPQENSLQPSKYPTNLRHDSSPVAVRKPVSVNRADLQTTQLSSPSIVNRNKIVDPLINGRISPIKDFKTTVDKKLQTKHSSDSIVLRQPKKSEMTYFGVNISPKPVKKISQAVIRKENKLSEKPDLIEHYKDSPTRSMVNQSKSRLQPPEKSASEHVYENIKSKYNKEFDSSILDELTKAADQILQAVNEYSDDDVQNRLNSDEEGQLRKKQLETISETKSWKQEKTTAKTKPLNTKTKLKPTSSTSSVESLNRKKATNDQTKTTTERQRRRVEKTEQNHTKAANTKARRLQRASSREALLHSHGSSSEDLPTNVELSVRKPRLIKKTKVTQLTMTNGVEMKKSPSSSISRRREDVAVKGEERILGSLPEIRHKTAVSTIRSTSEKTRDKTRHRCEDVRKKTPVKRETTKVSNPSSRMETTKNTKPTTHNRETVTHRISTAYVPVCRNTGRNMHARQRDTDCPCLCS